MPIAVLGNSVFAPSGNHVLDRLGVEDRARIDTYLKPVTFERGQILYKVGERLGLVYFPISGMISLVAVMQDGHTAETASVGREGCVGLGATGAVDMAFVRYDVQIPGTGYSIEVERLEEVLETSAMLRSVVARFREVFMRMALQAVACNALHLVERRVARCVLTTHDRSEADLLLLTQEFLASMLGVQRGAVNTAARGLQARGLIGYARGKITILDRVGLEAAACECYALIRSEITKLFAVASAV